jgi:hypothetical protein
MACIHRLGIVGDEGRTRHRWPADISAANPVATLGFPGSGDARSGGPVQQSSVVSRSHAVRWRAYAFHSSIFSFM